MKSKWFKIEGGQFSSKQDARTMEQAWEKTLEKWSLIEDGYCIDNSSGRGETRTCGLCNLFYCWDCQNCPIFIVTRETECGLTPFWYDKDDELLFLLFVKVAWTDYLEEKGDMMREEGRL